MVLLCARSVPWIVPMGRGAYRAAVAAAPSRPGHLPHLTPTRRTTLLRPRKVLDPVGAFRSIRPARRREDRRQAGDRPDSGHVAEGRQTENTGDLAFVGMQIVGSADRPDHRPGGQGRGAAQEVRLLALEEFASVWYVVSSIRLGTASLQCRLSFQFHPEFGEVRPGCREVVDDEGDVVHSLECTALLGVGHDDLLSGFGHQHRHPRGSAEAGITSAAVDTVQQIGGSVGLAVLFTIAWPPHAAACRPRRPGFMATHRVRRGLGDLPRLRDPHLGARPGSNGRRHPAPFPAMVGQL
ncbi:hypothetical protein B0I33_11040 [Prauserella shujinwangii]|uniref:Uncharacterized protein n=1 Tax=Prauserella shujinwangii TaxID=1453103 RepID=A0A2T0LNW5_9PSEU|nr:hypothetical protein B0I33_11040 [Prauserella shujinwangii]